MPQLHARKGSSIRVLVLTSCIFLFFTQALLACTSFCLKDDASLVFGKNYDWHLDNGLVIVNKSGVTKRALLLDQSDKSAEWVSKYGSVTFNQYGRELPNGGMNEAGLVLEVMMLPSTRHPDPDSRPAVMAWVQYQLDSHATIKEVIESDKKIRLAAAVPMPLHFLGCDRQGNVATFEFLNGKFVCHVDETLPVTALTNDTYKDSVNCLKQYTGFGGEKTIPCGSWGSLDRFVCTADRIKKYRSDSDGPAIEYAFETLEAVKQGDSTKWKIVYDLNKMEVHYKTFRHSKTKTIRLRDCDFDLKTPVQVISVNTSQEGLLNPYLHHYETDLNRWLVYYSIKHTPLLSFIPESLLEILVQYPESPVVEMSR